MTGHWNFTLDGHSHTVTAAIMLALPLSKMNVTFDGDLISSEGKAVFFGKMATFHRGGHQFVIRIQGFGMLGKFLLEMDGRPIETTDSLASPKPPPLPIPNFTSSIIEVSRESEPLGEEMREIDNSRSSVDLTRKIILQRDWRKTFVIEHETAHTISSGIECSLPYSIGIKATAERAIKDHYAITHEEQRRYSEEVTVSLGPFEHILMVFKWKQLWQCGTVLVTDEVGNQTRLPYRVQLEPTFDQQQLDQA